MCRHGHRIAVLPFDNLGGDEATGRLADGITEDIITDLARFRELDVIARNSTEAYKGKPVDVRQVGKELNVGYVLEGSIQRQGERVRVTAQLVDAGSGAHVWSERWDRPAEDVFAVQTEVAEAVAGAIGGGNSMAAMTASAIAQARRRPPTKLTAYDHYLLAVDGKAKRTREVGRRGPGARGRGHRAGSGARPCLRHPRVLALLCRGLVGRPPRRAPGHGG